MSIYGTDEYKIIVNNINSDSYITLVGNKLNINELIIRSI
jgi:hypothetical protein